MRQLVERLRTRIVDFISQREDVGLVLRCTDSDCALVTKVIEGQDESSSSELFWVVVEPFADAPSFVDACVTSFATRHEAVRLALERQNRLAWPTLPSQVADATALPPVDRLKELMIFSRSLLPTLNGCGVVWALLPMLIADRASFTEFADSLLHHEFPFPWCHHVRMIIRDDFETAVLATHGRRRRVQEYVVDFSPESIRHGLEEEAGDEAAPLGDRVNSCLMLAAIDFGHGRYDRAIQQYDIVHQYAASVQNHTLAAIALNGMSDAFRAVGKLDESEMALQAAIAPATLAPQPPVPVLLDLYGKLGEMRAAQERWPEAEVFLQGAADFAFLMRDPDQRLRYLKILGEAQYAQNKTAALKTWFAGAVVAGKLARDDEYRSFVKELRNHYVAADDTETLRRVLERIRDEIAAHDPEAVDTEALARVHGNR